MTKSRNSSVFITAVALARLFTVVAIDRTTVAEQSAISDPAEQCTIYNFPPIADEIPKFPNVFTKAKILEADDAARAKFEEISSNIPAIAPKKEGDIDTYDADRDPDCWWTATLCTQPKAKGVPADISLVPEPQTLGYGFDDGPNCSHNAFYDHLTAQNQKATMFFIGSNVLSWPLQAKRAMDDGHEICVHTWSHLQMTTLSNEDAFAEIYYTIQAIKLLTGATPTCFRPPFGDIDDRIRAISNGLGLTNILWQFDTEDSVPGPSGEVEEADVQKGYLSFIKAANNGAFSKQGAILLAHETNNLTMQQAVNFYPQLRAAFKHIVPIGVAFNKTQPYVEKDFEFPDFAKYIETEATAVQNGTSSVPTSSTATGTASSTQLSPASPPSTGSLSSTASASAFTTSSRIISVVRSEAASATNGNNNPGTTTLTVNASVTPTGAGFTSSQNNSNGADSLPFRSPSAVVLFPVLLLFFVMLG